MLLGGADGHGENQDGAGLDGQAPDLALHRAEIDQATGMLTVQLDVSPAEAFVRLRAYAYSQDRRLAEVAGDIVAGACDCAGPGSGWRPMTLPRQRYLPATPPRAPTIGKR